MKIVILKIFLFISLSLLIITLADSLINRQEIHYMSLLLIPLGIAGYYLLKKKIISDR